jgi:hypothetical protein
MPTSLPAEQIAAPGNMPPGIGRLADPLFSAVDRLSKALTAPKTVLFTTSPQTAGL